MSIFRFIQSIFSLGSLGVPDLYFRYPHSYPRTGSRKTGAAAIKRAATKDRNRKRAKRKGGAA